MAALPRGDADEFILARYRSIVETIRKRLCIPDSEALDLAHDVIAAIYESLDSYDPARGPFEAWVAGIVRNHVLRRMEGRGRRPAPREAEPEAGLSPLEAIVLTEVRSYLGAALERQPPLYRETLRLRYLEGKDLKQIAKSLKVPVGTVKARLSRAPAMLKEGLRIQQTTVRFYLDRQGRKT